MRFKTISVKVTQQDIDDGEPGGCGGPGSEQCPIGLALVRATGLPSECVSVWLKEWCVCDPDTGKTKRWRKLPFIAREFIWKFDYTSTRPTVKPFEFSIKVRKGKKGGKP